MSVILQQMPIPNPDLPVSFAVTSVSHNYVPRHWHKDLEIIYLISGSLEVSVGGLFKSLSSGDGIMINSQIVHSTLNRFGNRAIVLLIPMEFMESCRVTDSMMLLPDFCVSSYSQEVKSLLLEMKDVYLAQKPGFQFAFYSLLFCFLELLYKEAALETSPQASSLNNHQEKQLQTVIAYIEKHYTQPISLEEIAGIAHLQPQYFCRFFKRIMGQTFTEYLNELRMSKAYHDIIATEDTIQSILAKHGFHNYKVFRRLFHEKFQCTPTELRKASLHYEA